MLKITNYGEVTAIKMSRTILGRPIYICIAYFVDGLLIDTGNPHVAASFSKFISEKRIDQAILTHHHEDHSGNSHFLNEMFSIKPFVHPLAIPILKDGFDLRLYQRFVWGIPKPVSTIPYTTEIRTKNHGFKIIETPEHSEDMIVLIDEDRGWLFSGDLFIARRTKFLRVDEDANQTIESLKKVLGYEFNTMFCAHRGKVENGKRILKEKLDYLEEKREKVVSLRKKGYTEQEISRRVFGREELMTWLTGRHFSKLNFVKSYLK